MFERSRKIKDDKISDIGLNEEKIDASQNSVENGGHPDSEGNSENPPITDVKVEAEETVFTKNNSDVDIVKEIAP